MDFKPSSIEEKKYLEYLMKKHRKRMSNQKRKKIRGESF
jgi:hypothetical protein